MKNTPVAYISIPKHVDQNLYGIYIRFLTSIGYKCITWNRSEKYSRSIMNDADIHFVIYDFNEAGAAKMGYLPKGSTQESGYAKNKLNIPSYLIYLPVSNKKGLGFFNFEAGDWLDEDDWTNYSEISFKGRAGIVNVTYELLEKYDIYHENIIEKITLSYIEFINNINKCNYKKIQHYQHSVDEDLLDNWKELDDESIHGYIRKSK